MSKILLTGGCGFIGRFLHDKLISAGYEVVVVDNLSRNGLVPTNITNHVLTDAKHLECSDITGIDTIIHLASLVGSYNFYRDNASHVMLENTMIDTAVVKYAMSNNVKNFIYASSSHVYPSICNNPFVEEDASELPSLTYGYVKRYTEHLLESCDSMNTACLRYNGIFGPEQNNDLMNGSVIPVFIRRVMDNNQITMMTNGKEQRSFCYIEDACNATMQVLELMENNQFKHENLNVCTDEVNSIIEIAEKIKSVFGNEETLIKVTDEQANLAYQSCNNNKIKSLTGWGPQFNLLSGLEAIKCKT